MMIASHCKAQCHNPDGRAPSPPQNDTVRNMTPPPEQIRFRILYLPEPTSVHCFRISILDNILKSAEQHAEWGSVNGSVKLRHAHREFNSVEGRLAVVQNACSSEYAVAAPPSREIGFQSMQAQASGSQCGTR